MKYMNMAMGHSIQLPFQVLLTVTTTADKASAFLEANEAA